MKKVLLLVFVLVIAFTAIAVNAASEENAAVMMVAGAGNLQYMPVTNAADFGAALGKWLGENDDYVVVRIISPSKNSKNPPPDTTFITVYVNHK